MFKPTLKKGLRPILQKTLGNKEFKLVYDVGGSKMVKNIPVPSEDRRRLSISDDDILQLARWACQIEEHYTKKRGCDTPMDMEWAKDGLTGEVFIVQARPETVQSRDSHLDLGASRPITQVPWQRAPRREKRRREDRFRTSPRDQERAGLRAAQTG